MRTRLTCALLAVALALPGTALAQQQQTPPPEGAVNLGTAAPADQQGGWDGSTQTPVLSDEQADMQDNTAPPTRRRSGTSPIEDEGEGYWFLGLIYRHLFVPTFALNLFVSGGSDVSIPGGGVMWEYRKNGLSIIGQLYYQDATFRLPFRERDDPDQNTEILNAKYAAFFATATFLWYTSFADDIFAIEYGFNIGAGALIDYGTRRWEAYPNDADPTRYTECRQAGDPNPMYCDAPQGGVGFSPGPPATNLDGYNGAHYNVQPRRLSQGGGIPDVVPMLGPVLAIRLKPIRQLQIRAEVGLTGFIPFNFGLSVAYGF